MTRKIAFLVSDNLLTDLEIGSDGGPNKLRDDVFELDEQVGKLKPAFAAAGLSLEIVRWREIAKTASDYEAVLPLMVWDYFEGNEAAFMEAMAKAAPQTLLLNGYDVLKWNANKSYLDELEARGAPVIPAITVARITPDNVAAAFEEFGADKIVIKPQIGGGAWRQVLLNKGEAFPNKEVLPPEAAIIQPFLPSVVEEGEYSLLYFGGEFSHAVLKQAKDGDYRIQSIYGGRETTYEATPQDRAAARAVLDVLDFTPLYARVDLLRGLDGGLKLIELEMLEPYLYLPHSKGEGADNLGAQNFVKALVKRLDCEAA